MEYCSVISKFRLWIVIFILFCTLCTVTTHYNDSLKKKCPCETSYLCKVPERKSTKEVFAFVLKCNKTVWKQFDWKKLTTIILVGYERDYDAELYCHAHRNGVKVVTIGNIPKKDLSNATARHTWVKNSVKNAHDNYLDGINLDYEDTIDRGSPEMYGYTDLVSDTTAAFHSVIPGSQVTVDVAWSPADIDKRGYDYAALANVSDFLFVMAYDEQSRYNEANCTAKANSGLFQTLSGLKEYLKLNISADKLVLGVPWYGYRYPCTHVAVNGTCFLKPYSFRGSVCSDAVGRQFPVADIIYNFLPLSTTGRWWDSTAQSPYFNYQESTSSQTYQVRYDDTESLIYKYTAAVGLGLRGVGMWTANFLNYSKPDPLTRKMWAILPN